MERLAVYGTLRARFGRHRELGLEHALVPLGACRIAGRLVDLDAYPGLVPGDGLVEAELFGIRDARVLARIDAYEGYEPARPERSLFTRRWVRLARPSLGAWVYAYARDATGRAVVASGCWASHVAAAPRYSNVSRERGRPPGPL
ncbi:MAG: gamma-glutamylcyclotransferase family protein [Myxococcota bacterium]